MKDILMLVKFIIVIHLLSIYLNLFFQMHLELYTGKHLLKVNIFLQGKLFISELIPSDKANLPYDY